MKIKTFIVSLISLATPALADELNIYSNRQDALIAPVIEQFKEETGIDVNVAYFKNGIAQRLKSERRRTMADIVLTVDAARMIELSDLDLLQPIPTEITDGRVPQNLLGENNNWAAITTRARVIYASKNRVGDNDIKDYSDLADDKWKNRICSRSGTNEYNLALTSSMIFHKGEAEAKKWLQKLKENLARKPQGNDRAQVKAIWAGECDIALGNTYYMGLMLKNDEQKAWANSVKIIFPEFEEKGTHINISGVGITKHTKNLDAAKLFVEFLLKSETQKIYANVNNEYPVLDNIEINKLTDNWNDFTADTTPLEKISSLRKKALQITNEVDFDG